MEVRIGTDESTGRTYLKLPLPSGDALRPVVDLLSRLVKSFGQ